MRTVYFGSATFTGLTSFGAATFTDTANFRAATFTGPAYFCSATFDRGIPPEIAGFIPSAE